jgi:drug/metabolite transporter (DMT)-like permease
MTDMLTPRLSLAIFAFSLAAITAAQLLSKWRIGIIQRQITSADGWPSIGILLLSDGWVWLVVALILLGAAAWYVAMSQLPLGLMLPVASIVAPCAAIGAHYFLGEPITSGQVSAIAVIAIGVAWLGYQH